jgi:hypothetical protein
MIPRQPNPESGLPAAPRAAGGAPRRVSAVPEFWEKHRCPDV